MNRADLRELCRDFLAVASTDPFYPDDRIDRALTIAALQLTEEIRLLNPAMMQGIVTLYPVPSTGLIYPLASQTPPITDFHQVIEFRLTDENGALLTETDDGTLTIAAGGGFYSLLGPDNTAVLKLDPGISPAKPVYLKYARKSASWDAPSESPDSIPVDFHDVVAYRAVEALFAYGGEAQLPPALAKVSIDRTGALWHHISRRTRDPERVPNPDRLRPLGLGTVRR